MRLDIAKDYALLLLLDEGSYEAEKKRVIEIIAAIPDADPFEFAGRFNEKFNEISADLHRKLIGVGRLVHQHRVEQSALRRGNSSL